MSMRIGFELSVMFSRRKTDFYAAASARNGLQHEIAAHGSDAFLHGEWSLVCPIQLSECPPALELESLAVIFNGELPHAAIPTETHESVPCSAVFSNIRQEFLNDARQLLTDGRR